MPSRREGPSTSSPRPATYPFATLLNLFLIIKPRFVIISSKTKCRRRLWGRTIIGRRRRRVGQESGDSRDAKTSITTTTDASSSWWGQAVVVFQRGLDGDGRVRDASARVVRATPEKVSGESAKRVRSKRIQQRVRRERRRRLCETTLCRANTAGAGKHLYDDLMSTDEAL